MQESTAGAPGARAPPRTTQVKKSALNQRSSLRARRRGGAGARPWARRSRNQPKSHPGGNCSLPCLPARLQPH